MKCIFVRFMCLNFCRCKHSFLFSVIISMLFLTVNFYFVTFGFIKHGYGNTIIQNGCTFPPINPLDPTILKYVYHPKHVSCPQVQPHLTFIDDKGYLQINSTEIETTSDYSKVTCSYKTFDRSPGTDDKVWTFEKEQRLKEPVQLKQDMVFVWCNSGDNDKTIYRNLHAHPAKRINKTFNHPTENQLSVLVNVIDSVSFSELQRNMPLTYSYVTKQMNMNMFKRLNKIADNSLPNMIAVLTGKRIFPEQEDMLGELNYTWPYSGYYDHFNLIWKDYAAKGYAVVYNEDQPNMGLFHYETNGFMKKPVDYYYPIFWRVLENEIAKNKHKKLCFANTPKAEMLLDIVRRHLISANNRLQFMISYSVEYSHDRNNDVEKMDAIFAQFWRKMFEGGHLNKTAVIFLSDHGHRFGVLRKTLVGLLEERNPFYGIWFPDWFYKLHPNIKENLKINSERLSSTFDVYETLKDILNSNFNGIQRPNENRGLSQLYQIPISRTCTQAGIPEHHCLCMVGTQMNISSPELISAAARFVTHLNFVLSPFKDLCQKITLKSIIRSENLGINEKVKDGVKNYESLHEFYNKSNSGTKSREFDKIRLTIETKPNDAVFEAVLNKHGTQDDWFVSNDVERLNAYGKTSYCINNVIMQKYCSCNKNIS